MMNRRLKKSIGCSPCNDHDFFSGRLCRPESGEEKAVILLHRQRAVQMRKTAVRRQIKRLLTANRTRILPMKMQSLS